MLRTLHDWLTGSRTREPARRVAANLAHYWINPDVAPDRAAWMRAQFAAAGIADRRVAARTPATLPPMRLPRRHEASPLQLACLASHFAALEQALADGDEAFLIVEDDMRLAFDVDFARLAATAPRDWDILQLYVVKAERIDMMYRRDYRRARLWRGWHPQSHSTGAYLCSRDGARKLVERFVNGGGLDFSRYRGLLVADDLLYRCVRTYTATYPLYIEKAEFGSTLNSLRRLHIASHAAIERIWQEGPPPPFAQRRASEPLRGLA